MKTQLWLQPDQIELMIECLNFVKVELDTGICTSDAHKMAGRFTYRRINELLKLIEDSEK